MDERLVSKIQKLLSLGAGEGHEAQSAMAKAGKLMAENDIGLEDIDANNQMKSNGILEEGIKVNSSISIWEISLAFSLCKAFDCRCLNQKDYSGLTRLFIGTKSDLKLLTWYYKFLRIKIAREAETKFRLQKDKKSFGIGAAEVLGRRLVELFAAKEQAQTTDTKALVVTKVGAVSNFIQNNYCLRKSRCATMQVNADAMMAGQQAGSRISLNRPIAGKGASPRGLK